MLKHNIGDVYEYREAEAYFIITDIKDEGIRLEMQWLSGHMKGMISVYYFELFDTHVADGRFRKL